MSCSRPVRLPSMLAAAGITSAPQNTSHRYQPFAAACWNQPAEAKNVVRTTSPFADLCRTPRDDGTNRKPLEYQKLTTEHLSEPGATPPLETLRRPSADACVPMFRHASCEGSSCVDAAVGNGQSNARRPPDIGLSPACVSQRRSRTGPRAPVTPARWHATAAAAKPAHMRQSELEWDTRRHHVPSIVKETDDERDPNQAPQARAPRREEAHDATAAQEGRSPPLLLPLLPLLVSRAGEHAARDASPEANTVW